MSGKTTKEEVEELLYSSLTFDHYAERMREGLALGYGVFTDIPPKKTPLQEFTESVWTERLDRYADYDQMDYDQMDKVISAIGLYADEAQPVDTRTPLQKFTEDVWDG